jgi:hypothetical protein
VSTTLSFRILERDEGPLWDTIAEGDLGGMCQTTWWARPLEPFGVAFDILGWFEGDRLVGGTLIRSSKAPRLPFSLGQTLGGPILPDWSQEHVGPFLDGIAEIAKRRRDISVDFRDVPSPELHASILTELARRGATFFEAGSQPRAVIDLRGRTADEVLAAMRQDARYSIRRARRRGVEVRELTAERDLVAAFDAFQATSSRKGFQMRPRDAAVDLLRESIGRGCGIVFGAVVDEQVIAALFVTFMGPNAVYESGGYLDAAKSYRPNHLLHMTAIEEALRRHHEGYDLGPLSGKKEPTGVDEFKIALGGEVRPSLKTIRWSVRPVLGKVLVDLQASRLGNKILKRVRRYATRIAG